MSMAKAADADVILVADIDRGGVFASVVGTLMLLEEEERSRVKGVIINKFRGNVDYFKDAMKQLEEIINIPVLGVLPYFKLDIEDEDSVTERIKNNSVNNLDIAVIRLPHMSNFTDFSSLERIDEVSVRYIENVDEVNNPDLIIISGRQADMYDKFAEIATTVYLSVDGSDYLNDFSRNLDVLGKIFGKEDFVKENLDNLTKQMDEVKAMAQEKNLTKFVEMD